MADLEWHGFIFFMAPIGAVVPSAVPCCPVLQAKNTYGLGPADKEMHVYRTEKFSRDSVRQIGRDDAIDNFRKAKWTSEILGEDVKGRYADLKQASADRCPRLLGSFVKTQEVQYHHDVYNQFLWNLF